MRVLFGAILLCSPLVLVPIVATSAHADSAIDELHKTEPFPTQAAAPPAASSTPGDAAADPASRPVRRHRVAGSHYEREHLRPSQIHG